MNPILYFYLIHFLADYPFQPNSLVKLKSKSYLGIFIHCVVHLIALILVLFPFLHLNSVWIGIAVIFGTHNIIDYIKVRLDKKYPKKKLFLYLMDQIAHLIVISLVAFFLIGITPVLSPFWQGWYTDQSIVTYMLIMVLMTYFYDVTRHFVITRKKSTVYKRDYRTMLRNVFIVSIAFGMYWLS